MSSPDPDLTIGAMAALAGKRPSAIRYYEQIGLLPPAARVGGRRVYGPDTVRTLAVIETGQRALHDHRDFDQVAGPLAERYRTIAVDWPGHGRSDLGGRAVDAFLLAVALAELVEGLRGTPSCR